MAAQLLLLRGTTIAIAALAPIMLVVMEASAGAHAQREGPAEGLRDASVFIFARIRAALRNRRYRFRRHCLLGREASSVTKRYHRERWKDSEAR